MAWARSQMCVATAAVVHARMQFPIVDRGFAMALRIYFHRYRDRYRSHRQYADSGGARIWLLCVFVLVLGAAVIGGSAIGAGVDVDVDDTGEAVDETGEECAACSASNIFIIDDGGFGVGFQDADQDEAGTGADDSTVASGTGTDDVKMDVGYITESSASATTTKK